MSCNTFFFQLGSELYDQPNQGQVFQKQIRRFGFGQRVPLDLPVPYDGLVPDPAWRLQTYSTRSTRSGSPATTSRWRSARAI